MRMLLRISFGLGRSFREGLGLDARFRQVSFLRIRHIVSRRHRSEISDNVAGFQNAFTFLHFHHSRRPHYYYFSPLGPHPSLQKAFPGRLSVVHAHAVIPRDWLAAPGEPEKLCCPAQKLLFGSPVGSLISRKKKVLVCTRATEACASADLYTPA